MRTLLACLLVAAAFQSAHGQCGASSSSCCSVAEKTGATLWPQQTGTARRSVLENVLAPQMSAVGFDECTTRAQTMSLDAFSFYRGNSPLYFSDMTTAGVIRSSVYEAPPTTTVPFGTNAQCWLAGDMHLYNMGTFAIGTWGTTSTDYLTIYDINDFDEAWTGHYLYDLYRLAASVVLLARQYGISDTNAIAAVGDVADQYHNKISDFKSTNNEDTYTWQKADADAIDGTNCNSNSENPILSLLSDATAGSVASRRFDMLEKWTTVQANGTRIFDQTKKPNDLRPVDAATWNAIVLAWSSYYTGLTNSKFCVGTGCVFSTTSARDSYFRIRSIAKRINAGLGSLGLERYYVLIDGYSTSTDDDHILDVKFQGTSRASSYGGLNATCSGCGYTLYGSTPSLMDDRAIDGMKKLLYRADDHLGSITLGTGVFTVRERSPEKGDLGDITTFSSPKLRCVAKQLGRVLASAHAKTDGSGSNVFETAVYNRICNTLGKTNFMDELANWAIAYANQVATDFSLFKTSYSANPSLWCGTSSGKKLSRKFK